jgi:hypothetical protein
MELLILIGLLAVAGFIVMTNEITATDTLTITKDGTTVTGSATKQETLAGTGKFTNVQLIGTSTEQIVFPADLITEGITHVWMKNLDATNYVQIGLNTPVTQIFARLKPGQTLHVPTDNAPTVDPTFYAKANTASCNVQIVAVGT